MVRINQHVAKYIWVPFFYRYMEHHSGCFAIDPLDKIYPVLDQLKVQKILLGLDDLNKEGRRAVRGPHFLMVF